MSTRMIWTRVWIRKHRNLMSQTFLLCHECWCQFCCWFAICKFKPTQEGWLMSSEDGSSWGTAGSASFLLQNWACFAFVTPGGQDDYDFLYKVVLALSQVRMSEHFIICLDLKIWIKIERKTHCKQYMQNIFAKTGQFVQWMGKMCTGHKTVLPKLVAKCTFNLSNQSFLWRQCAPFQNLHICALNKKKTEGSILSQGWWCHCWEDAPSVCGLWIFSNGFFLKFGARSNCARGRGTSKVHSQRTPQPRRELINFLLNLCLILFPGRLWWKSVVDAKLQGLEWNLQRELFLWLPPGILHFESFSFSIDAWKLPNILE